jgi:hypothetical protein
MTYRRPPTLVCELSDGRAIRMSCYSQDPWRAERLVQFVLDNSPRFRDFKPTPVSIRFEEPRPLPNPEATESPPEAAAQSEPDDAAADEIAAGAVPSLSAGPSDKEGP